MKDTQFLSSRSPQTNIGDSHPSQNHSYGGLTKQTATVPSMGLALCALVSSYIKWDNNAPSPCEPMLE